MNRALTFVYIASMVGVLEIGIMRGFITNDLVTPWL